MKRRLINKCFKKKKKKLEKPSSMRDMPDSASDGSEEGPYRGLSDSAMFIGEGPILFLQIMKTFTIMFFVLSLINVPVFWIYSRANEVGAISSIMSYDWKSLTLGTLGHNQQICNHTHITYDLAR